MRRFSEQVWKSYGRRFFHCGHCTYQIPVAKPYYMDLMRRHLKRWHPAVFARVDMIERMSKD